MKHEAYVTRWTFGADSQQTSLRFEACLQPACKQLFHPTPGNRDAENTNLLGKSDGPSRKAASPEMQRRFTWLLRSVTYRN